MTTKSIVGMLNIIAKRDLEIQDLLSDIAIQIDIANSYTDKSLKDAEVLESLDPRTIGVLDRNLNEILFVQDFIMDALKNLKRETNSFSNRSFMARQPLEAVKMGLTQRKVS